MKPGIEGLNPLDITNFYLFEGMGRNSLAAAARLRTATAAIASPARYPTLLL